MQKGSSCYRYAKDFVDGALGSAQAQMIVENVRKKYLRTLTGLSYLHAIRMILIILKAKRAEFLPVTHCVKNTDGWHIVSGLIEAAEGRPIMSPVSFIDKPNFGSLELLSRLEGMNSVNPIGVYHARWFMYRYMRCF